MSIQKLCLALFLPLFYLNLLSCAPRQDLFCVIDDHWHVDYEKSNGISSITEMTIEGETVDNWSELFTIQKTSMDNTSLNKSQFLNKQYQFSVSMLQSGVPPHLFHSKIISSDKNSIFYEWWIDKTFHDAQHEWCRVILTDNDMFIVRYTTKKLDEVEKVRSTWEKRISQAYSGNPIHSH